MLPATLCVLSTYELLEMILLYLPPARVLIAQRVSKTFQSMICSSKPLQQRLWYEQSPAYLSPKKGWGLNPMLPLFDLDPAAWDGAFAHEVWMRSNSRFANENTSIGSAAEMLLSRPPCRYAEIEFMDQTHALGYTYLIESTSGCMRICELVAVIREAKKRQRATMESAMVSDMRISAVGKSESSDWFNQRVIVHVRTLESMDASADVRVSIELGTLGRGESFCLKKVQKTLEFSVIDSYVN